jgi:hypothetical protein
METLLLKVEPDKKDFLLTLLHEFAFVEIISENYQQEEEIDIFDELDAHQQTVLMQAIEESEDEENLIPHEEVMKMYRQ